MAQECEHKVTYSPANWKGAVSRFGITSGLFQSEFTHPGGGGRLTKRLGGTTALRRSLAGKHRFPISTLTEQEPLDQ